ncbi:flagellar protein FliT [Paenibacillus aurantius]|uniref:Flagellar protein FliT n=1 Tax=Paenibacillus aurantius TaxID=2918900 RepID=A0AA96RF54_9BACL|nr:flagellar protein FliT [Paenibacillus aurantius]WNQ11607.1 flagellar protein FliT [Paenibacillus aurantius]
MDKHILELDRLTDAIMANLASCEYEELEAFVHRRGELISLLLQKNYSADQLTLYHPIIAGILEKDTAIRERMSRLKQEAEQGMAKLTSARMQKNAYESAYASDSVFFNQRK